jgi:iron complex outermembrane receptor protein
VKDLGSYYLSYPGLDLVLNEGIDPFSPEGAGAMSAATIQDNESTLDKIYGHVQYDIGDWFGAGQVIGLAGFEYFEMGYVNQYDRASEAGFVGGSAGNSSAGDRDVTAFFGEANIPVTDTIEVNAAIRYDDYSDFGSEVSPSLSGIWSITDSIRVRARWSTGFRAPALDELYGPETFSAEDATDYARCQLQGILPTDCSSGQVDTYYSTNDTLGAETSETFSVGMSWDFYEYWNVDFGFWSVEIEDVITQSTTQSVLYAEAAGVVMIPADGTWVDRTTARPIVYSSYTNAGELNVEGVDLQIKGSFETGVGDFGANMLWTHNLKFEQAAYYTGPIQETKGFYTQPEDRAQIVLTWGWKQHNVSFVTDYIGEHSEADFIVVSPGGDASLETSDKNLDSWTTFNLSYSFDAEKWGVIKIGARNLTDEDPVLDKSGKYDRDLYDLYDATGRVIYAEYKVRI